MTGDRRKCRVDSALRGRAGRAADRAVASAGTRRQPPGTSPGSGDEAQVGRVAALVVLQRPGRQGHRGERNGRRAAARRCAVRAVRGAAWAVPPPTTDRAAAVAPAAVRKDRLPRGGVTKSSACRWQRVRMPVPTRQRRLRNIESCAARCARAYGKGLARCQRHRREQPPGPRSLAHPARWLRSLPMSVRAPGGTSRPRRLARTAFLLAGGRCSCPAARTGWAGPRRARWDRPPSPRAGRDRGT